VNIKQKSLVSAVAMPYRDKWLNICCGSCNAPCRAADHVQPYHLLTYIRLSSLYLKGGIFSDFSFFFLGPISAPLVAQVCPLIRPIDWTIINHCIFLGLLHQFILREKESRRGVAGRKRQI
jgi:hypothetical protein